MNERLPGVIEAGQLYLAAEAQARLKLGAWGWRQMRCAGLPIIYQGRRAYVLGDDIIRHFQSQRSGGDR